MQDKPLGLVPGPEDPHGIIENLRRTRHLGQQPAVRALKAQLSVRSSLHLKALLVDGAMVPTTEEREIRERRGAAVGPVTDVMPLAESHSAPREAAAAVPVMERPS